MNFRNWAILVIVIVHAATTLALAMVLLDQAESWAMAWQKLRQFAGNPLIRIVYAGWVLCCAAASLILARYVYTPRGMPVTIPREPASADAA
jgi:succinate dehydrogenase/fumarate reductase cytochrome b subunit